MWNAVRKIYGRVDDNLLDTLSSGELSDRLIKNENEHKSTGNEEKDLEEISEKANKIRKEIKDRYRDKIRSWKVYSKQFLLNNLWRVQPKGMKKGIDELSNDLQLIFSEYFSLPNPNEDETIDSYNNKIKDKAATRANEFRDEMKKVYRSVRTTDAEIGFINHFYNKMLTPEQRKIFDSMPEKYRQEAIEKGTTKKEVKEYFDKYATLSKDTIEKERKKEAKDDYKDKDDDDIYNEDEEYVSKTKHWICVIDKFKCFIDLTKVMRQWTSTAILCSNIRGNSNTFLKHIMWNWKHNKILR